MKIKVIDKDVKELKPKDFQYVLNDKDALVFDKNIHLYNRYVSNKFRFSTARVKTRSEIVCSGAKAYKQKGTGNARRGRNSSALRRGGAKSFGPSPRSFEINLNKKLIVKMKALLLSQKIENINIISEKVYFNKTKDAANFLAKFNVNSKILLISNYTESAFLRAFRNIKNVKIVDIDYISPEEFLVSEVILFTESSFNFYTEKLK